MAEEKKSFNDLLKEAPLASSENTVSLVGALARSSEPNKFVLAMGQGNYLTLDVAAVKSHQVLGGGVGQLLVQIEIDRSQVPEGSNQAVNPVGTHPQFDYPPFALATAQQAPAQSAATQSFPHATVYVFDVNTGAADKGLRDHKTDQWDTGHWPYWD